MQDNNAERRNLIMTSMGFIVYVLGDAQLLNQQLQMGIVNLKFENMKFIIIIMWLIFFWFLWRYWLKTKKNHSEFRRSMSDHSIMMVDKTYFSKRVKKVLGNDFGRIQGFYFNHSVNLSKIILQPLEQTERKYFLSKKISLEIPLTKNLDVFFIYLRRLEYGLRKDEFGDVFIPYVLAAIAIFCGLYELLDEVVINLFY